VSTPESGQVHSRSLRALPSPDPAATPPNHRPNAGRSHAVGAGPDVRYEHLRYAALHARAEAFPLGLAVLTRQGLTAWTRALAELTPAAPAPVPAPAEAPTLPSAALTRELVNVLAALTLVPA
jgi:hypothetical protein